MAAMKESVASGIRNEDDENGQDSERQVREV